MRRKLGLDGGNRLSIANLPTNMLCSLVLLAGELGVNCESWFSGLRLTPREIQDPLARVSYRQATEVIRRALPTLPIEDVGLTLGGNQNGANFGLLGLAMRMAPNFGEAVNIGLTYQRNLGPLMDLQLLQEDPEVVSVVATTPLDLPEILPFLCEEMFSSVLMLARELAGPEFHPVRLDLTYPAPAYASKYSRMFECEVRFRQGQNRMWWIAVGSRCRSPATTRSVRSRCWRCAMRNWRRWRPRARRPRRWKGNCGRACARTRR